MTNPDPYHTDLFNLNRFVTAQQSVYPQVVKELSNGKKVSHWMWFIFPQLQGLGYSAMAQQYAISSLDEAAAYLIHPVLGQRLIELGEILLGIDGKSAHAIFGSPDDMKLHSSLTLFSLVPNSPPIFGQLLDKYFDGKTDGNTERLLNN